MAHNYGEPREGLFYHYERGTHPCPSCDRARVTCRDGEWHIQYFKDSQAIDNSTYENDELRIKWAEGQFRPMYSPIVALPNGA